MIEENRTKYGLSEDLVAEIKLPAPCHLVQVYDIAKILNPRTKLSTLEKIHHCIKLQDALQSKLEMLRSKKLIAVPNNIGGKKGRPNKFNSSMLVSPQQQISGIYGKAGNDDEEDVEEDDSEEEEVKKQPKMLGQNRVMV